MSTTELFMNAALNAATKFSQFGKQENLKDNEHCRQKISDKKHYSTIAYLWLQNQPRP